MKIDCGKPNDDHPTMGNEAALTERGTKIGITEPGMPRRIVAVMSNMHVVRKTVFPQV